MSVALLAVVLGAATLTACGGGAGGSSSSSDTLTVALPGFTPQSFDLPTNCTSPIFDVAYEPLIRISDTGGYAPGIAESWTYSANNTVFTMKIRKGVKFADGTDLTVGSVVDTLNYYKSTPGLNSGFLEPLTFTAEGSDSVKVTSEKPTRGLEALFSSEQCNNGRIISEAGLKNPNNMKTEMFGAGPYQYVADESGPGDHYTFVPNPNYFDKSRQHWKKIVMRVIGDPNTAFNALATGQVQVDMTGGAELLSQAESKKFDATNEALWGSGIFLWDREGEVSKPLSDVRVRQAMALALDRNTLALVGPSSEPLDQFIAKGLLGADPTLPSKYTYDVDKAKQLLADAGYPDGFSATMLIDSDDLDAKNTIQAAVEQLRKIGINITTEASPESTFFTDIASKKYAMGATSWAMLGDGLIEADRLYQTPYSAPLNPFGSLDPDLETAYEALATSDEPNLEKAAQHFNEVMTAKAWYIPIASAQRYLYSKGVQLSTSSPVGNYDIPSWKPAN